MKKSNLPRNIRKRGDKYIVSKIISGKELYFGIFSSLDEAVSIKEDLIIHNWDNAYFREKYSGLRPTGRPKKNKLPQYIRKVEGKYELVKYLGGKLCYFGRYTNLEDAVSMKDLMIKNNWSKTVYLEVYTDKRKNNGKKRGV